MGRNRPSVFLGSSCEGRGFALAVQARLQPDAEVTNWDQGIFTLGLTSIENLMNALPRFDFAVLVLTKDDLVKSRSTEWASPRDNVIFELGLFMGKLGRDRTFILEQPDCGLKIPSDLMGVTTGRFDWSRDDEDHEAAVATVSEAIRKRIQALGRRERPNEAIFAGIDPKLVVETEGKISTEVAGCEIITVAGRIQDYATGDQTVVVLPCNEYFDDKCASDDRSALGAYVSSAFSGRVEDLQRMSKASVRSNLGQESNARRLVKTVL